jgi:lysophospholipase L1-like esterase
MKRTSLVAFTALLLAGLCPGQTTPTTASQPQTPAQPQQAAAPQVGRPIPAPPEPKDLDDARIIITRLWTRSQDWPQLGRYRDANSSLGAPKLGERRVVFMGDSITDGWKLTEYFPDKPYVNRGIGGQTTPQMLIRFRPDVIDLEPRVVVILAGTNDLAGNTGPTVLEEIERNFQSMAELARTHKIRMVIASVLPVHDAGTAKRTVGRPPEKIRALNDWLKQYCAQNKLIYLDYYGHMLDDKGLLRAELANDGLHPNAAGYKIMAPLAEEAISSALKK